MKGFIQDILFNIRTLTMVVLSSVPMLLSAQESSIVTSIDSNRIVIGDPVHLTINITKPLHTHSVLPVVTDSITPAIGVIEQADQWDTVKKTNAMVSLKKTVIISAYDSGQVVIPQLPLIIRHNDTLADTLYSDSLLLSVRLLPVDTVHPKLADIKPPLDTPFNFAEFKALYLPKILIGLGILLLLYIAYRFWKKYRRKEKVTVRKQKPVVKPSEAHLLALKALDELKEKKLWQHDKVKEYYTLLVDILREYLENRYRISVMEKTSDEILEILSSVVDSEEAVELLRKMLPVSDLVKFAKYVPLPDENEQSLQTVYDFVEKTRWKETEKQSAENSSTTVEVPTENVENNEEEADNKEMKNEK